MKLKFSNWLVRRDPVFCRSGSGIVDVKHLVLDDDGVPHLEVIGKHDLYSEIQSHKDSVDIHLIVQRFKNGDLSALNRRVGQFVDVTDFPANYAEMLQSVIDARRFFESLPEDKQRKFGDFDTFLSSFGTSSWIDVFKTDEQISDVVKEVVTDEQEHGE